ncbi:hypothetical protein [Aeromonas media]|uniref:hypothetical protein n=1 Tax=Aeromonas media TaxID=651 RepID=UPI003D19F209
MLLKEKITYHANFELFKDKYIKKTTGEVAWCAKWRLESEKVQLDSTSEYFKLDKAADQKAIFKDLTKMGYGSRGAEYQAFKNVIKSHKLELPLYDCSYSWEVIDNVLTLYIANINFDKRYVQTVSRTKRFDNKWTEAVGDLIAIRYEQSEKQSQAIVYRESIGRKVNINSKNPTMHHKAELMKEENRKRAIKAKSLRDVVEVTNHNAEVLDGVVDEIAELKRIIAEQQAMMAEYKAKDAERQAAQLVELDEMI